MVAFIGGFLALKVYADDDEFEYADDEVSAPVSVQVKAIETPSIDQKTKTVTKIVVVKPAQIVTENQIRSVLLPDTDRDGIADVDDPHPDVAEIYIVKDDNNNGIVDTFEYGN